MFESVKLWSLMQRGKTNECPGYDTKPYDGEASVLEPWRILSTPSLWLLPGPLWSRVVVAVRLPSMGQVELLNCKQMTDIKLNC